VWPACRRRAPRAVRACPASRGRVADEDVPGAGQVAPLVGLDEVDVVLRDPWKGHRVGREGPQHVVGDAESLVGLLHSSVPTHRWKVCMVVDVGRYPGVHLELTMTHLRNRGMLRPALNPYPSEGLGWAVGLHRCGAAVRLAANRPELLDGTACAASPGRGFGVWCPESVGRLMRQIG